MLDPWISFRYPLQDSLSNKQRLGRTAPPGITETPMENMFKDHPQLGWNGNRISENIIPADFKPAASLRCERATAIFWN